jgi:hypothetical protein
MNKQIIGAMVALAISSISNATATNVGSEGYLLVGGEYADGRSDYVLYPVDQLPLCKDFVEDIDTIDCDEDDHAIEIFSEDIFWQVISAK